MATGMKMPVSLACCVLLFFPLIITAQVLTPPVFNLAHGRNITATATCGEGVANPELYCRLTPTSGLDQSKQGESLELIHGQVCDYCNPANPEKAHHPQFAIDGTERWWQSPPLSRLGVELNKVNLTISLGQEFHVAYVFIKMANSPRPGVWVLERSTDFGRTWKPWQYFADTPSDCMNLFNTAADQDLKQDQQVLCSTQFSAVVPFSNGEIVVSLMNGRPNANNFSTSPDLQEWTKATNVQLRLLRTKTLLAHLMDVARQDPTVTRRYFYSIKDISIGGRCVCNGHAETCDVRDPSTQKLICNCVANTCGEQCEYCCPGFTQKRWRHALQNEAFECEPCNCHGHSDECVFDEEVERNRQSLDIYGKYEGGGVCQNCRDNTEGINCEKCVSGYYRPYGVPRNATDVCRPCQCDLRVSTGECEEGSGRCLCRKEYAGINCDRCNFGYYDYPNCIPCECDVNGTEGSVCTVGTGQCPCKLNFAGAKCDQCAPGYYNFPECVPCKCNPVGTPLSVCELETGQCRCSAGYGGRDCGQCDDGFSQFPTCQGCNCDQAGTEPEICDKDEGRCLCKTNFTGGRCDRCEPGFYNFPLCQECECQTPGSLSPVCTARGQCRCNINFAGRDCSRCAPGYYNYPQCSPCNCDNYGSLGQSCDQLSGKCMCRDNFVGQLCDKCGENFYNYPMCEVCNCNPDGAKEIPGLPLGGCGTVTIGRLCECKERVLGRICDRCQPGYWNLDRSNPEGCEECRCHKPGTLMGTNMCDMNSGQCVCKPYVGGRDCDKCKDGFYNLQESNPFGCLGCKCNLGGSLRSSCDKITGQCPCKARITGKKCDQPMDGHFVPNLHQYKFEVEDGQTPEGARIRYGYDEDIFPSFSWRGYAILTSIQPEVQLDVDIRIPSLYQIIFRFVNLGTKPVKGTVTLSPYSPSHITQEGSVTFSPSTYPAFVKVTSGNIQSYVLNPGRWTISTKVPDNVFLDYFVLIPQSFYEASHLQQKIKDPCLVSEDPGPCTAFKYPDLGDDFPGAFGVLGYNNVGGQKETVDLHPDGNLTSTLDSAGLVRLNESQRSFTLDLNVPRPDEYYIVVNYHNPLPVSQHLDVEVTTTANRTPAHVSLPSCPYSSLCRQVLTGANGLAGIFNISTGYATVTFTATDDNNEIDLAIDSIYAIPRGKWTPSYTMPRIICIKVNGVCVASSYGLPVGTVLIQFEASSNQALLSLTLPPGIQDPSVGLVNLNDSTETTEQTFCPISNDDEDKECTIETVIRPLPLELTGKVTKPGDYVLLVQYYMPRERGLSIPVTVYTDGKALTGMFKPGFCPSTVGCRSAISFDQSGGNTVRLTGTDVRVVFNGTQGAEIWLDYLLVVPKHRFSPDYLDVLPIDNSEMFITKCVDEGFQLNITDPFCQAGAFTLVTNFNNGAMDCECSPVGSRSFTCEAFGGGCTCKENVIGRQCTACAQGYYNFPNCLRCNCPYGVCHEVTGECICPPNVEGEKCDRCKRGAYGYDALIGCQLCNCNPQGTVNSDNGCDQLTGQCNCKANVGERRCDKCLAGFHSYPSCEDCGCDRRGTIAEICDIRTAECLCKDNVQGQYCDQCADGMFSLTTENPKGCIKCFCNGHTSRCDSAGLSWDMVSNMTGWHIASLLNVNITMDNVGETLVINSNNGVLDDPDLYWLAPASYLGKKMTSYGGKLEYTVLFTLPNEGESEGIVKEDLILTGSNMTFVYYHNTQPVPNYPYKFEVELREYNFRHVQNNAVVSREQFMMLLAHLDSLVIRASYYTKMGQSRLEDVTLQVASKEGMGELAESVEMCQCPPNYMGMSCEYCAPGNYRPRSSTSLGICVKCNCNGHSDDCDVHTGECYNCRDNTTGPHCNQCLAGYHGDPATGACSICSCPLPISTNNFATSCTANADGYTTSCSCQPGYTGLLCDSCAPGYYGDPLNEGSYCKPCGCSGNIDLRNPASCDRFSGACLLCENNSGGLNCDQCRDWFWGDAIIAKDCQPCTCDRCGSDQCDNIGGNCECKPNVVGADCDQCAPNFWGFEYCDGCRDCGCGVGAVSGQCDLRTGRCECQPGVEGEKCDRCMADHWNIGPAGCQKCECESDGAVGCDSDTGRCRCLAGVTGEKCDRCLPRWVLVPNRGCQECDYCVHLLIDDLDRMASTVSQVSRTLADVSVGVGAFNRLSYYNDTVDMLRPAVEDLYNMDTEKYNKTLSLLEESLMNLTKETRMVLDQSASQAFEADDLPNNVQLLKRNASEAQDFTNEAVQISREAVDYIRRVKRQLTESRTATNIDLYITNGEKIVKALEAKDFSGRKNASQAEIEAAEDALVQVKELKMDAMSSLNSTKELRSHIDDIESRLQDLGQSSRSSLGDADSAMDIVRRLRAVQIETLDRAMTNVKALAQEREMKLKEATMMLQKAEDMLMVSESDIKEIESESSRLEAANPSLEEHVAKVASKMDMLLDITNQSQVHADGLANQAAELERVYGGTRNRSEDPVAAGQAYQKIESAIEEARASSDQAVEDANTAKAESDGISDNAADAILDSEALLEAAEELSNQADTDLKMDLEKTENEVKVRTDEHQEVQEEYDFIAEEMVKLEGSSTEFMTADVVTKLGDTSSVLADTEALSQSAIDNNAEMESKIDEIVANAPKASDDIRQTQENLDSVAERRPQVESLAKSLSGVADRVGEKGRLLGIEVATLKEKIALARDEANRIKMGLRFQGNTTVTLRNPPTLKDTGSYSTASMFFWSIQPDALLMYVGNNQNVDASSNSRAKRSVDTLVEDLMEDESNAGAPLSRSVRQVQDLYSDYMALELRDGRVVFTVNLGSGAARIISNRRVNNGKWHQILVERIGKTCKLVVKSADEEDDVVEGTTQGTFAVLELNPITTHILLGGMPDDFRLPRDVNTRPFVGGVEEVIFDGQTLGLWNFVKGKNNNVGERRRDFEVKIFLEGVRFNGMGYAVLSKAEYRIKPDITKVGLSFKTFAEDGLLFYMSKDDYFSVEMREGKVILRYDLGSGPAVMKSSGKYNNGQWHKLLVERNKREAVVYIDDKTEVIRMVSQGNLNNLETTDDIYIGGIENFLIPHRSVMNVGFDGCIKDVRIGTKTVSLLNDNKRIKGVVKGCLPKITHIVSFPSNKQGYLGLKPVSIGGMFDLTFKMKTTKSDALLMIATDQSQLNTFAVYMSEGKIVVGEQLGAETSQLVSKINTYGDGEWHYISIMKMQQKVTMSIDDTEMVEAQSVPGDLITNSPLYFGGIPSGFVVSPDVVPITSGVGGCMGDITINKKFQNLANVNEKFGVRLAECSVEEKSPVKPEVTPDLPEGQCALQPVASNVEGEIAQVTGTRFGSTLYSRHEYNKLPVKIRVRELNLSINFKTTAENGVMFYTSDEKHTDFFGVYMTDGQLNFGFNFGSGSAHITSPNTYNDGQWHTVKVSRKGRKGTLGVDGEVVANGNSRGNTRSLNTKPPYYVGGIREDMKKKAMKNLKNGFNSFPGCLDKITVNTLELEPPAEVFDAQPCSDDLESGSFVGVGGGHVKLFDKFNVGKNLEIIMQIRPRSQEGILLAVHSTKSDYLVLQMSEGAVIFTIDNGAGPITVRYEPPAQNALCDGNWHVIKATKEGNGLVLSVDEVAVSNTNSGNPKVTAADTNDPLYVGGVKDLAAKGIVASGDFVGCVRNVRLNSKVKSVAAGTPTGDIRLDACPIE